MEPLTMMLLIGLITAITTGSVGLWNNIKNIEAQKEANQTNVGMTRETNQQNLDIFRENLKYTSPENQVKLMNKAGINPQYFHQLSQ
jgi:hypothetical protein